MDHVGSDLTEPPSLGEADGAVRHVTPLLKTSVGCRMSVTGCKRASAILKAYKERRSGGSVGHETHLEVVRRGGVHLDARLPQASFDIRLELGRVRPSRSASGAICSTTTARASIPWRARRFTRPRRDTQEEQGQCEDDSTAGEEGEKSHGTLRWESTATALERGEIPHRDRWSPVRMHQAHAIACGLPCQPLTAAFM